MYFYVLLFALPLAIGTSEVLFKFKKEKYILFLFLWVVLVFFTGFRANVGNDYTQYKEYFLSGDYYYFEFGFSLVTSFIYYIFGKNNLLFFLSMAMLSYAFKWKALIDTPLPVFGLVYFFLLYGLGLDMNLMRQGIAVSVVLLAIHYLIRDNVKYFIILIVLASTFHITSLVVLVLPLARNIKFNYPIAIILLLTASLASQTGLADYALTSALSISSVSEKLIFYAKSGSAFGYESGFKVGWLKKFFMLSLFYFLLKGKTINNININVLFWSLTIGYIIGLVFDQYGDFAKRLPIYFEVGEVIMAVYALYLIKTIALRLVVLSLFAIIAGTKYFGLLVDPAIAGYYIPYNFLD